MFQRFAIPTPFQVGDVNTYLAGRTLIDPGPESEEAWSHLLDELEARGLTPGDVEQVLVTHPHPDHFGLANRFQNEGATVFASEAAAAVMADFEGRLEYEQSFFREFFERHGMAASTADTVTGLPEIFVHYAPSCDVDEVLAPDDTVAVNGEGLRVREVAGHAPGEIIFEYDHAGTYGAVVGDTVLADITPNPLLQPPPESGGERPRPLIEMNRSLERLRDRDYDRLLPGHREPIESPRRRITEIREANESRTDEVFDLLEGPTTAVEVIEGLFGDLPVTEQFPGMSEAVGHLDVLEARDRVTFTERGGLVVYERAAEATTTQ